MFLPEGLKMRVQRYDNFSKPPSFSLTFCTSVPVFFYFPSFYSVKPIPVSGFSRCHPSSASRNLVATLYLCFLFFLQKCHTCNSRCVSVVYGGMMVASVARTPCF